MAAVCPRRVKTIFAKPHNVRQRRSIAEILCTVCGEKTPVGDWWWFKLGRIQEGYFMTTEAPVPRRCADFALNVCRHLRGREADLEKMPGGYMVLSAIIGGAAVEHDFGVNIDPSGKVIGSLKLAWPMSVITRFDMHKIYISPISCRVYVASPNLFFSRHVLACHFQGAGKSMRRAIRSYHCGDEMNRFGDEWSR